MALRSTDIVASTTLTQVGAEGSPTNTTALTVSGTLDGTPSLKVEIPTTSQRVIEGTQAGV